MSMSMLTWFVKEDSDGVVTVTLFDGIYWSEVEVKGDNVSKARATFVPETQQRATGRVGNFYLDCLLAFFRQDERTALTVLDRFGLATKVPEGQVAVIRRDSFTVRFVLGGQLVPPTTVVEAVKTVKEGELVTVYVIKDVDGKRTSIPHTMINRGGVMVEDK